MDLNNQRIESDRQTVGSGKGLLPAQPYQEYPVSSCENEAEISLTELGAYLWTKRKHFRQAALVGLLLGIFLHVFLPRQYSSKSTLLPLGSQGQKASIAALAALAGVNIGSGDSAQNSVKAVLESLTLCKRVVEDLGWLERLAPSENANREVRLQIAAQKLKGRLQIKMSPKDGVLSLVTKADGPEAALQFNQSVIKNLRVILNEKSFSQAKMNRQFYETEMLKTREELRQKLEEVSNFQKQNQVIFPDKVLSNQVELYTAALTEKLQLEGELQSLKSIYAEAHPQITEKKKRLQFVTQKIQELEMGSDDKTLSIHRTLNVMPEFVPIYVQLEQLKARYEMMAKMLEQAKFDEIKESLFVEVIDEPSFSLDPDGIRGWRLVVLSIFATVFVTLGIFVVRGIYALSRATVAMG